MGLDHDKLKQRRAGARSGSGWRPKAGVNVLRFLPPHSKYLDDGPADWEDLENFAIEYKMHYFKIEGRPTEVTLCLAELKQRCPACDTWRIHRKSEDPGLKEMAREIAPADQYLFNILDLGNLQAGIQKWSANWTCWDKVMEIGGNPAWGNVVDPANGVDFQVTMTPGSSTRSGYNSYSVTPNPTRTTVMAILEGIEDWRKVLDDLESQKVEPKTAEEVIGLLKEIGFPQLTPKAKSPAAPAAPAPVTAAPVEPAASAPPVEVHSTPIPIEAVLSVPVTPVPVTAAPAEPAAPAPVAAAAPAPTEGTTEVHYDPGEGYTPKQEDRPVGAPRCYGDYEPQKHRCAPCPVQTECQMILLGVAGDE